MGKTVLETERLRLREMGEGDFEFLTHMLCDATVMRYWPRPYTIQESREWLDRQIARYDCEGFGYWIAETHEGHPLGQAGLMLQEFGDRNEVGVGYIFAEAAWGKGYATEATRACLEFGFNTLALPLIVALIRPVNERSLLVAERLGMREVAESDYRGLIHCVFELSADEFRALSAKSSAAD